MSQKIEKLENNQVKFDITIDAKTAEKAYNQAVSKMGRQVNIPGFRKGKAPKNVIEKYLGEDRIKVQVIEDLLPNELAGAIDENKLDLAIRPSIQSYDFEVGKDLTVVAIAEVKPEVILGQYKDQTIEFDSYKTPDDALKLELESIQHRFSEEKTVEEDRAAEKDDLAVIDFEGFVDDTPIERGSGKNYTLDLAHSNFIPGFAEGIVGHKKGEEFTIDVTFPENYGEEKLKGAKAQFKIKLNELKTRILPELNDELAKKVGKFESAEALKNDISKFLEDSANQENHKRKTEAIFNKVLDEAKIDIQESMIQREVEAVFVETRNAAQNQGQDFEKLVEKQGRENVEKQAREEALRRIKNSLVIEKIAKTEGIKIEQNDIVEQVTAIANAYRTTPAEILKEVTQNQHFFTAITQQAAIKKVNDILLNNNTFVAK